MRISDWSSDVCSSDLHPAELDDDGATLAYTGLDDRRRETHLRFDPAPTELAADRAVFEVELAPSEIRRIFIEIRCGAEEHGEPHRRTFFTALREARRAHRAAKSRAHSPAPYKDLC